MAKRELEVHACKHCVARPLNLQTTKWTEVVNFGIWRNFASRSDLRKLKNHPGLEDFLRSQLRSLVIFDSTTTSAISEGAEDGCLLFQYIHDRIAENVAAFPKQLESCVEPMDAHKPFAELFDWRRNTEHNPFVKFMAWCRRTAHKLFVKLFPWLQSTEKSVEEPVDEKILIFIEPQIGPHSSTFCFRWFITPYRPFHALHFVAPEIRKGCHVANDWVHVDPFQVVVSPQSQHERHFPRFINYDPGHPAFLDHAKAFFTAALEEEGSKQPSSPDNPHAMPSRLLKIHVDANEEPETLSLLETGLLSEPLSFVALSYCWGGPQQLRLLKDTKSQLITGIQIDTLPKTLKDATIVAKHLGIPYIWIDALCIIQDDKQDLYNELALMPMIYENAAITIVASRAKSVAEGFLHERLLFKETAEIFFGLTIIEPYDQSKGDVETQVAIIFPVGDLVGYKSPDLLWQESNGIPTNPLISRAWTYQERSLSPRVIDFGLYGTRCRILDPTDGSETIESDGWKDVDWANEPKPPNMCSAMLQTRPIAINTWQQIVLHFTGLDMTCSSDRLPAISAFARFFSPAFGGAEDYAAGIWKSSMPFGLLWQTYVLENTTLDGLPGEESLAPSWSWAALTSWIGYPHSLGDGVFRADQGAEVIEAQVKLQSSQVQFGAVTEGTLRMRGRLRPVRLSLKRFDDLGFDWPFFDETRIQTRLRSTKVVINMNWADPEERGLHKREYYHENHVFRDYKLPIAVTTDREHVAAGSMIGDSSTLFALPIASIPANISSAPSNEGQELEEPPADNFGISDMYNIRPVYGLLLLRQSADVYQRVALFRTLRFNFEDLVLSGPFETEEAAAWFQEQHKWLGYGEAREFSLI